MMNRKKKNSIGIDIMISRKWIYDNIPVNKLNQIDTEAKKKKKKKKCAVDEQGQKKRYKKNMAKKCWSKANDSKKSHKFLVG